MESCGGLDPGLNIAQPFCSLSDTVVNWTTLLPKHQHTASQRARCCRLGCNHEFEGCTRRAPAFPEAITESPAFGWHNPHLKWRVDHIRVKVGEQGRSVR